MKQIIIILIVLMATSCAYHGGMITSTPNFQNGKKVEYVDIAVGYSKASYFLGFGGLNNGALISQAKSNIYATYPLKPGQSFENMTINEKTTLIYPFMKVEVIAIADVAQRDTSFSITYSPNYRSMTVEAPTSHYLYKENENVYIHTYGNRSISNGKVVASGFSSAKVFSVELPGQYHLQNYNIKNLYKKADIENFENNNNVTIGDSVCFNIDSSIGILKREGKVVGVNLTGALIISEYSYYSIKYDDITKLEVK